MGPGSLNPAGVQLTAVVIGHMAWPNQMRAKGKAADRGICMPRRLADHTELKKTVLQVAGATGPS